MAVRPLLRIDEEKNQKYKKKGGKKRKTTGEVKRASKQQTFTVKIQ